MLSGFGNYLVPLQIGARDMAFPRLNAFGYWVFLGAGLFIYSGLALGRAPERRLVQLRPALTSPLSSGPNIDFYGLGLIFLGISTTAGAVNFIVTIVKLRAPGMSIDRMPLFCWAILATSFSHRLRDPLADRRLPAARARAQVRLPLLRHRRAAGDPLLWQHLFWIFGHPDVYIIFLPAVGIVSLDHPVFSRRPMVAHTWVALATVAPAFLGFGVWVHHMFAVGLPQVSLTLLRGGEHDDRDPERDPGLRLARHDARRPTRAADAVPLRRSGSSSSS